MELEVFIKQLTYYHSRQHKGKAEVVMEVVAFVPYQEATEIIKEFKDSALFTTEIVQIDYHTGLKVTLKNA